MKSYFWRRWSNSLCSVNPAGSVWRATARRHRLSLQPREDRVTPTQSPQMVLDINATTLSGWPSEMVAIGSTTYFSVDDGVHGRELWKTDGSAAGTTLVKDIYPGSF